MDNGHDGRGDDEVTLFFVVWPFWAGVVWASLSGPTVGPNTYATKTPGSNS